ncbi:MAG: hypothetical protein ACP5JG_08335 [Anaerolineae bacterium]
MQKRRLAPIFLVLVLAIVVLAGCGPNGDETAEPEPTATSEPQAAPSATPSPVVEEPTPTSELPTFTTVELPDAGLTFEIPESWVRLDEGTVWAPSQDAAIRVGFKWSELNPPQEPEAVLLPENAQIVSSEQVETSIGNGRRFLVSVYAPATEGGDDDAVVASVETHVLVIISDQDTRRGYDFYAAADSEERLPEAQLVLDRVLATASLAEGIDEDPEAAIRAAVAESLNAQLDEVAILELEPREWPDACLGLPQEGQACATVITPGYQATVRVGDEVYEVRTNQDATQVTVVPEEGDEPVSDEQAPPAVSRARTILADHLGVSEDAIALVSFEQVEWPDACLGIRNPNQACAQVITPGYRIIFDVNGREHEVHTDLTGDVVAIVPNP